MWKQKFQCHTEDETFSFSANPEHLNQVAAIILVQHGAKFAEISDMANNVLMLASYNPDSAPDKQFVIALPEVHKTAK